MLDLDDDVAYDHRMVVDNSILQLSSEVLLQCYFPEVSYGCYQELYGYLFLAYFLEFFRFVVLLLRNSDGETIIAVEEDPVGTVVYFAIAAIPLMASSVEAEFVILLFVNNEFYYQNYEPSPP